MRMAMPPIYIEEVRLKKNTIKYKVRTIGEKTRLGKKVQVTRTFTSLVQAKAFRKKLETQFTQGDFSIFFKKKLETIGNALIDLLDNPCTSELVKTKSRALLRRIATQTPIMYVGVNNLADHHWYKLAEFMVEEWGIKPQTASNYLSTLKGALKKCKVVLRYEINFEGYYDGLSIAKSDGFSSESVARISRVTKQTLKKIELALIREQLARRRELPMVDIFRFAIGTALRLGEICGKITWMDIDPTTRILTVRNRKTPKKGKVITSRFKLSDEMYEIIVRQPRGQDTDLIFPYKPSSVSNAWRCLMKELEIDDFQFRDLRAEALCCFFEAGLSLTEIAKISGHKDLNTLNNFYLRLLPSLPSRLAA
ncbi:site-specific integrase [Vibrio parahaemolyticus]|uniref:Putative integrase/recombinase n=1 Tax=Vibrio parahaemolyticus TaxID=670 RepID=B5UAD2_VIBPH|nr:site-specific integrase [Vibrio parahaemolyticus]TOC00422.1 site-specific integrase [Vibrio parahaemolyticus]WJE04183.1 site-specific integrase [Vibrio parahaemolyticus]BAG74736.1 putative integrase/recombinase [Vibrio parahaemolyticus]HCE2309535.1 site-specific integrase [Vibrio parahaemolyticus]HCE4678249.1 site-specific integrase [Vibrio parahaemolyticus]